MSRIVTCAGQLTLWGEEPEPPAAAPNVDDTSARTVTRRPANAASRFGVGLDHRCNGVGHLQPSRPHDAVDVGHRQQQPVKGRYRHRLRFASQVRGRLGRSPGGERTADQHHAAHTHRGPHIWRPRATASMICALGASKRFRWPSCWCCRGESAAGDCGNDLGDRIAMRGEEESLLPAEGSGHGRSESMARASRLPLASDIDGITTAPPLCQSNNTRLPKRRRSASIGVSMFAYCSTRSVGRSAREAG